MSGNDGSNPWGDTSESSEGSGPSSDSSSDSTSDRSADSAEQSTDTSQFEQATAVEPETDSGDRAEPEPRSDTMTDARTSADSQQPGGTEPPSTDGLDEADRSSTVGSTTDHATQSSGETAERRRPEESDPALEGPTGMRNYTQDLLEFEFVFDSGDDFSPQSVNADGVVLTQSGDYVGMARVTPRSWSIHTQEKKHQILQTFQSGFLSSLDFYTQIVCYPTAFDTSEHIDRLEERLRERSNAADESPLVQYGRQLYPRWLTDFIEREELTQREYFVVVRVDPTTLRQFDESESLSDKVGERAEAFGAVVSAVESLFGGDDGGQSEASREECVREVKKRLRQVRSSLKQIDVGVDLVEDRDEVLSVIYHYYNDTRPNRSSFDVSRRTVFDEQAELNVDGFDVDDLVRPDYGAVGDSEVDQ